MTVQVAEEDTQGGDGGRHHGCADLGGLPDEKDSSVICTEALANCRIPTTESKAYR